MLDRNSSAPFRSLQHLLRQNLFEQFINYGAAFREQAIKRAHSVSSRVGENNPIAAFTQPPIAGKPALKGLNLAGRKMLHRFDQSAARFRSERANESFNLRMDDDFILQGTKYPCLWIDPPRSRRWLSSLRYLPGFPWSQ